MPIYSFRCGQGHETEWVGRFDARPVLLPCASCGTPAEVAVALPARGFVVGGTDGGKGEGTMARPPGTVETCPGVFERGQSIADTLRPWGCGACGKRGWDDDVPTSCPSCASTSVHERAREFVRDWWDAEGFGSTGYYDRGAGRWFYSRAERKKWADDNGMIEVAGVNDDTCRAVRKENERLTEMDIFWREHFREMDQDPEYRQMKARGIVPADEWIREMVGYTG